MPVVLSEFAPTRLLAALGCRTPLGIIGPTHQIPLQTLGAPDRPRKTAASGPASGKLIGVGSGLIGQKRRRRQAHRGQPLRKIIDSLVRGQESWELNEFQ